VSPNTGQAVSVTQLAENRVTCIAMTTPEGTDISYGGIPVFRGFTSLMEPALIETAGDRAAAVRGLTLTRHANASRRPIGFLSRCTARFRRNYLCRDTIVRCFGKSGPRASFFCRNALDSFRHDRWGRLPGYRRRSFRVSRLGTGIAAYDAASGWRVARGRGGGGRTR
jgi:hypothetical protein